MFLLLALCFCAPPIARDSCSAKDRVLVVCSLSQKDQGARCMPGLVQPSVQKVNQCNASAFSRADYVVLWLNDSTMILVCIQMKVKGWQKYNRKIRWNYKYFFLGIKSDWKLHLCKVMIGGLFEDSKSGLSFIGKYKYNDSNWLIRACPTICILARPSSVVSTFYKIYRLRNNFLCLASLRSLRRWGPCSFSLFFFASPSVSHSSTAISCDAFTIS